jgi:hypothetical protein
VYGTGHRKHPADLEMGLKNLYSLCPSCGLLEKNEWPVLQKRDTLAFPRCLSCRPGVAEAGTAHTVCCDTNIPGLAEEPPLGFSVAGMGMVGTVETLQGSRTGERDGQPCVQVSL